MAVSWLRVWQHLLPTGQAWRTTVTKTLRKFFEGLSPAPARIVEYYDQIYLDYFPDTTRELEQWEAEFGLEPNASEATRRLSLAAEWAATGGQSPAYIQGVLQTAGFDLYVHEWWSSGPPYLPWDPHDFTVPFTVGTYQCDETNLSSGLDKAQCRADSAGPQCNAFLSNDPHYFANKDLTPRPPPPIPDDPDYWRFFLYIGAPLLANVATIPASRRGEFERLILKLRPTQNWIVTRIQYGGVFDDTFSIEFS